MQMSTTRSSCRTVSHRAAAAPGSEVRRECPMSKFTALPLLATNPGDATGSNNKLHSESTELRSDGYMLP